MSLGSHTRHLAPGDPFARGAAGSSAHPESAVAARSQRAHKCAERPTPTRTVEEAVRGLGDEALGMGPHAWGTDFGLSLGGSAPAESRYLLVRSG